MFGVDIGLWQSHWINIYSILAGVTFFNFLGQGISRSVFIRETVGSESAFLITALERVLSIAVLVIFSITAAIWVFGRISIDVAPSVMLAAMTIFVLSSFVFIYAFFLIPREKREFKNIFFKVFDIKFLAIISIVILMHLCMLESYLSLILGIAGVAILGTKIILATLLTQLGASTPISFGGWGIREISAGFAFRAASLPPEIGVGASHGMGELSPHFCLDDGSDSLTHCYRIFDG